MNLGKLDSTPPKIYGWVHLKPCPRPGKAETHRPKPPILGVSGCISPSLEFGFPNIHQIQPRPLTSFRPRFIGGIIGKHEIESTQKSS